MSSWARVSIDCEASFSKRDQHQGEGVEEYAADFKETPWQRSLNMQSRGQAEWVAGRVQGIYWVLLPVELLVLQTFTLYWNIPFGHHDWQLSTQEKSLWSDCSSPKQLSRSHYHYHSYCHHKSSRHWQLANLSGQNKNSFLRFLNMLKLIQYVSKPSHRNEEIHCRRSIPHFRQWHTRTSSQTWVVTLWVARRTKPQYDWDPPFLPCQSLSVFERNHSHRSYLSQILSDICWAGGHGMQQGLWDSLPLALWSVKSKDGIVFFAWHYTTRILQGCNYYTTKYLHWSCIWTGLHRSHWSLVQWFPAN